MTDVEEHFGSYVKMIKVLTICKLTSVTGTF